MRSRVKSAAAAALLIAVPAFVGCGSNADHGGYPARIPIARLSGSTGPGAGEPGASEPGVTVPAPDPARGHMVGSAHPAADPSASEALPSASRASSTSGASPQHSASKHAGTSAISEPLAATYEDLRAKTLEALAQKGPVKALRTLDLMVARQPRAAGVCHAVAHELGHATLARYDGNAARALAVRNDVCGGGYTHGVVEIALRDSKNVGRDMMRICAPRNDGSCWHGVGHGVLFATSYRTAKAEALCLRAPTPKLVVRCSEGLYMQLFTLDEGAAHVAGPSFKYPSHKTAARICTEARLPDACWFYSPTLWLQERPEDWKGALRWCDGLRSALGRATCTTGVGSRLVKYHPDDIEFAAKRCRIADTDVRDRCMAGMGSYWQVHWHGAKSRASMCRQIKAAVLARWCRAVNG